MAGTGNVDLTMSDSIKESFEDSEPSEQTFKESVSALFDQVRFPRYRIACKLRHLQKVSKFYLIDLYNTIESFREFGLNISSDLNGFIPSSEVYSIILSIFTQLSQRVPKSEIIFVEKCTELISEFIIETFDTTQSNFVSAFALKIALTLLCSSTYSNKLRYLFTLLSDENEVLVQSRFELFLEHILAIPKYFEPNSIFSYNEDFQTSIFNFSTLNYLQQFIEVLTNFEHQAELTSWLIVYHRLADAELVTHKITCSSCRISPFNGFRYKCKQCSNYNLCQNCFWIGKSSNGHDANKHHCKEYLFDTSKNLSRTLRNSFRNSFRCFPQKQVDILPDVNKNNLTKKRLNLSNIISSPKSQKSLTPTYDYVIQDLSPVTINLSSYNLNQNEEHNLISHYLYLLKNNQSNSNQDSLNEIRDITSYEQTIDKLETKNRELMRRIAELKKKNLKSEINSHDPQNSDFFQQLVSLRRKKEDLEVHLNSLSNKRKALVQQLECLMKELNTPEALKDYPVNTIGLGLGSKPNSPIATNKMAAQNLIQQLSACQISDHELNTKSVAPSVAFS